MREYTKKQFGLDNAMCPCCEGESTYLYNEDDTQFSYDNTGHYISDHKCHDCNKSFRLVTHFNYVITSQYTR